MAETKKTTTAKSTAAKATTTAVKSTTKATKAAKEVAQKQIKVTLVKSTIGYNKKQARVVKALGLNKLNSSHTLPDNACVRGMVNTISHLVKLEELN